jgi:5-methylcytosine-specific restriction protein B
VPSAGAQPASAAASEIPPAHDPEPAPVLEAAAEPSALPELPVVQPAVAVSARPAAAAPPAPAAVAAAPALLERARAALLRRGQLVLAGPPGSGKSHLALRLAEELVASGDGLIEHLVFHPAWRYADFVQAVRPDGTRQAGRFTAFCRLAAARKGPCVLLIDVAERAELADVFGEALALLDARGREVALAGGGSLLVPPNVRVVLTLDASGRAGRAVLGQLLNACAVLRVDGDARALRERCAGAAFVEPLLDLKRALDAGLADPDRGLPLGFFLRADLPAELPDVWRTEVEPWLAEALAGEPSRVAAFRWEAVAERLGVRAP